MLLFPLIPEYRHQKARLMNEALKHQQFQAPNPAHQEKQEKYEVGEACQSIPTGNLNPNVQCQGNVNPNVPYQGNLTPNVPYQGNLNPNVPYQGPSNPFISKAVPRCGSDLPGSLGFLEKSSDRKYSASTSGNLYRTLTEEENQLIQSLEINFRMAVETPCNKSDVHGDISETLAHVDGVYNTIAVTWARMFLKFVKTVMDFRTLDIDTQINSLKASIRCCLMLIAAYTFDTEENSLVLHDIKIPLEEFKKTFTGYKETTEKLVSIFLGMQTEPFKDPGLMAIFEMIIVFYPAWDNVGQRTHLSNLQDKYHILLKHYLEAKHSFSKGKEYFALIIEKFRFMNQVAMERKEIIANMGSDKLVPFAKELFEVKKDKE